jgi:hypothetical protein
VEGQELAEAVDILAAFPEYAFWRIEPVVGLQSPVRGGATPI